MANRVYVLEIKVNDRFNFVYSNCAAATPHEIISVYFQHALVCLYSVSVHMSNNHSHFLYL